MQHLFVGSLLPLFAATCAIAAAADSPVELVIALERGVQGTAPQQWLQQFTSLGIEHVQMRSIRTGDAPQLESLGSAQRPRYRVTGVLSARNVLELPGGRFEMNDGAKLRDYLADVAGDGAEGVLAPKGRFGLTEQQFTAVHTALAQPLGTETAGLALRDAIAAVAETSPVPIVVSAGATPLVERATGVADDVSTLTHGTALAAILRAAELELIPFKRRGEEVELRIEPIADHAGEAWPVGWPIEGNQRAAAPKLFEFLTFEVQDHTLQQALDALAPRLGVPLLWDHLTLAKNDIDPTTIKVRMNRSKTYHKRIIDRLLFQARLKGNLRTDEAGTVFVWVSR